MRTKTTKEQRQSWRERLESLLSCHDTVHAEFTLAVLDDLDAVYAAAVLVEEPGEALKEANNFRLSGGDEQYREAMGKEAVQSGAMAVRFLLNLKNYKV